MCSERLGLWTAVGLGAAQNWAEKPPWRGNEKTAIPVLLEELDLKGALVSIDAIANRPAIAEQIVAGQGHYLLSLKKNQKHTFEQVHDYMMSHHVGLNNDQNIDFGSGRIETRTCYVTTRTDLLEETLAWKHIQSIVMVHAVRKTGNKQQEEYRFYLSDLAESPAYFNEKIREHWGVENHLHWQLDVSFSEDTCRTNTKMEPRTETRCASWLCKCSNKWMISTASKLEERKPGGMMIISPRL